MNKELVEKLLATLEKYGISKAKCGRDMGYSSAVISAYTTGNYSGDLAKLESNINRWIARQEQAHSRKKIQIVETSAFKQIFNAIELAHAEHDIALITADAGSSKTTTAKRYAETNDSTVIYIAVVAGMNRKALVTEIAKQLGVETRRVQLVNLIQDVAEALAGMDSLVILDEADYLKPDALEFVRRLVYDLGESGLVLIGLPRLRGQILNLRNDHRQLESRIGINLSLEGLTKSDATLIARSVWENCSSDIVNQVYSYSRNDVRQFTKILERMQNVMALNNLEEPNEEVVEAAASMILRRH